MSVECPHIHIIHFHYGPTSARIHGQLRVKNTNKAKVHICMIAGLHGSQLQDLVCTAKNMDISHILQVPNSSQCDLKISQSCVLIFSKSFPLP